MDTNNESSHWDSIPPEIKKSRLWDVSIGDLELILDDPNHPQREEAQSVAEAAMKPIKQMMSEQNARITEAMSDAMKRLVPRIDFLSGWGKNPELTQFASQPSSNASKASADLTPKAQGSYAKAVQDQMTNYVIPLLSADDRSLTARDIRDETEATAARQRQRQVELHEEGLEHARATEAERRKESKKDGRWNVAIFLIALATLAVAAIDLALK